MIASRPIEGSKAYSGGGSSAGSSPIPRRIASAASAWNRASSKCFPSLNLVVTPYRLLPGSRRSSSQRSVKRSYRDSERSNMCFAQRRSSSWTKFFELAIASRPWHDQAQ